MLLISVNPCLLLHPIVYLFSSLLERFLVMSFPYFSFNEMFLYSKKEIIFMVRLWERRQLLLDFWIYFDRPLLQQSGCTMTTNWIIFFFCRRIPLSSSSKLQQYPKTAIVEFLQVDWTLAADGFWNQLFHSSKCQSNYCFDFASFSAYIKN